MASIPGQLYKFANENLDYVIDWSDELGADTISSVVWTVDTGITQGTTSSTTTTATSWFSGGTANESYEIVCKVTTAASRVHERTLVITVLPPSTS